jgi:hypothetical protein
MATLRSCDTTCHDEDDSILNRSVISLRRATIDAAAPDPRKLSMPITTEKHVRSPRQKRGRKCSAQQPSYGRDRAAREWVFTELTHADRTATIRGSRLRLYSKPAHHRDGNECPGDTAFATI